METDIKGVGKNTSQRNSVPFKRLQTTTTKKHHTTRFFTKLELSNLYEGRINSRAVRTYML